MRSNIQGNALSFGLSHTQSYSNNEYRNGHYYETNMHQENTYIFGEYRGKIDKLNYRLGVAMTRFYYNQSGKDKSTENYNNLSIVLHYAMSDNSYLRWKETSITLLLHWATSAMWSKQWTHSRYVVATRI